MNYSGSDQSFSIADNSNVTGDRNRLTLASTTLSLVVMGSDNSIVGGNALYALGVSGNGNNITTQDGPATITTSGDGDLITVGAGANTVTVYGNNVTLATGSGTLQAVLIGNGETVNTGASGTIRLSGVANVVQLGAGNTVVGMTGVGGLVIAGTGVDTFALAAGNESNSPPTISGYTTAADHIAVLVNSDRYSLVSQDGLRAQSFLDSSQFEVGTQATRPSTRFVYNPSTGHLIFTPYGQVPITSDVAVLPTNLSLQASDIFISNQSDGSGSSQQVTDGANVPGYTAPPTPAPTAANFAFTDETTGVSSTTAAQPYIGPVNYLQQAFIYSDGDKIDLSAQVPNVYIAVPGNEAISVSSGHNVISGGVGSNFLIGTASGQGTDTFFTDARTGGQLVWNTIGNFHAGDTVTLWGFTQGVSTFYWADNEGADGFKGITLHASLNNNGVTDAMVTLAGLTRADLASTPISYGNAGGNNPYLAINFPG